MRINFFLAHKRRLLSSCSKVKALIRLPSETILESGMYRLKIYIIMPKNILPGTICNFLVLLYTLCVLKDIFIFSAEAKDVILFFHTTTRYFSLCHNFVHLLARKPNLEKFSIYSSKFFPNFLLSESSFTCPWLQASGLGRRLLLFLKRSV